MLSFLEQHAQEAKPLASQLEWETEFLFQTEIRSAWELETLSCASILPSMLGWGMESAKLSYVLAKP